MRRTAHRIRNGTALRWGMALGLAASLLACRARTALRPCVPAPEGAVAQASGSGEEATRSRACGVCHPAIYAEHVQNTHGAAFVDPEARLATRDFRRENCVRCHTPRPVFETGLGMVPIERRHDLEEGNTCMSCHGKAGYDYASFRGGAECKTAFDDRVGSVEACATCHRIAGTPEQWAHAREGKLAGRACVDCHMPLVERPVAVGATPRQVRSHRFPGSRSEDQLRRAYTYETRLDGGEVVVSITNAGAGHNFPTAAVQRSLESVVVVRDAQGRAVATDRKVFKHPYAETGSLDLPKSTQIPSGQTREHRVALPVASGTVECRLFFKIYYPIADDDPTLSRRLEARTIAFTDVTPSTTVRDGPAGAPAGLPEVTPAEAARTDGLAKYAHPGPGTVAVAIPEGESGEDVARLVSFLEFPVPGVRARARERLVQLGARAVPALVEGLGHWSDETRDESTALLARIGLPAEGALRAALRDPRLYVRYHARGVLARLELPTADRAAIRDALVADLSAPHPLDRRSATDALGRLGDAVAAPALRPLLRDPDPDVVASAATALGLLDDRSSVPTMEAALARVEYVETRRDLAGALASLGSPTGIPVLLAGLDHRDDVIRRGFFDVFFRSTGLHESYDPDAPRLERLEAIARLASTWAVSGGAPRVRREPVPDAEATERAWRLVEALGGGTDTLPGGDDAAIVQQLVAMGADAVPSLIQGLTFPPGFVDKRALVCETLGKIGDPRAAPYLVRALRDPEVSVASWACWALSTTGDAAAVPALRGWSRRLASLAEAGHPGPGAEPVDRLLARAAWTRDYLGDPMAAEQLAQLGSAIEVASSPPPPRPVRMIATLEAPPVPEPTSPADAIEKAQKLRAQDFYEDAVRVLRDSDARFGPTAPVRLETAWNLLMIGEEDVTRDAEQAKIDAEVAIARQAFDQALRMDPHVEGQELLEAKLLRYEGSNVQARALLKALVERTPGDAAVHREYADFAFTTGDWTTAEREYSALAKLTPKDGWPVLYATISKQWLERPAAELEAGYLEAARRLPEEPMAISRLAGLYENNPAKNAALLERLIADRPEAVEARVALARILVATEPADRGRAERVLREAVSIAPKARGVRLELGRLLEETGGVGDAVKEQLEALRLSDPRGVAEPSEALDRLLRDPRAADAVAPDLRLRAWGAVIERAATPGRYAHDAGLWYLDLGHDAATAVRFLEAAAKAEPGNAAYRTDLDRARGVAAGGK